MSLHVDHKVVRPFKSRNIILIWDVFVLFLTSYSRGDLIFNIKSPLKVKVFETIFFDKILNFLSYVKQGGFPSFVWV